MHHVHNFIRIIGPGNHTVLFYESLGFKHKVLFTYLKSGLESGITGLYISHKEPATQIMRGMRSLGIDVESYARSGLFELWEITPELQPTETPISSQPPYRTTENLTSLITYLEGKTIKKSLVVVDDPLHNMKPECALNFEKFHSSKLAHTPISLICTYSTKEVSLKGKLFLDLVRTHRHIIIQTSGTIISLE